MNLRVELVEILSNLSEFETINGRKALLQFIIEVKKGHILWEGSALNFTDNFLDVLAEDSRSQFFSFLSKLSLSELIGEEKRKKIIKLKEKINLLTFEEWEREFIPLKLPKNDFSRLVQQYIEFQISKFKKYDEVEYVELHSRPTKLNSGSLISTKSKLDEEYRNFLNSKIVQPKFSERKLSEKLLPDDQSPEVEIEQFLVKNTRVSLLGAPGAGKSTTLHRLFCILGSYWQLHDKTNQPPTNFSFPVEWWGRVPFYLELKNWKDNTEINLDLLGYLRLQVTEQGVPALGEFLPDLLKKGQLVLLLDGLNELPLQLQDQNAENQNIPKEDYRITAIKDISYRWPKVPCIVTCRVNDFKDNIHWHNLHLLNLTTKQVEAFANVFFKHYPDGKLLADKFNKEFFLQKDSTLEKLRGVYQQPFYLLRLLRTYQEYKFIPNNITDLLEFSIQATLNREQKDKQKISQLEADQLQKKLELLAFEMTYTGVVSKTVDYKILKNDDLLKWYRLAEGASLLISDVNTVQFYHQLLQEHFCARYCKDRNLDTDLLKHLSVSNFNEVWRLWGHLDKNLVRKLVILYDPLKKVSDKEIIIATASALGLAGAGVGLAALSIARLNPRGIASSAANFSRSIQMVKGVVTGLQVVGHSTKEAQKVIEANTTINIYIYNALTYIGVQQSVEQLTNLMEKDEDEKVKCLAISCLVLLLKNDSSDILKETIKKYDGKVRKVAKEHLKHLDLKS